MTNGHIPHDRVDANGLVTVYLTDTGAAVKRWAVDAREQLLSGEVSLDPKPASAPTVAPAASPKIDPAKAGK